LLVIDISAITVAVSLENLTSVFAVFFVGPIISYILAVVFLKETVNLRPSILLFLGFCGILIIARPGFGFTLEPKSKKEYFKMLNKINKIKKLDKESVKKCFAYNYLTKYLALERIPIIHNTDITMQFEKRLFWKKTYNLLKKNGVFYQSLYNSLKFQIEKDNSYLINLNRLNNKY
jgi:hypothetical protein